MVVAVIDKICTAHKARSDGGTTMFSACMYTCKLQSVPKSKDKARGTRASLEMSIGVGTALTLMYARHCRSAILDPRRAHYAWQMCVAAGLNPQELPKNTYSGAFTAGLPGSLGV